MEQNRQSTRKVSRLRYAASIVALAILVAVLASFGLGHVGNYEVLSNSMAPTLWRGDRVLVDQRPHFKPAVGDIVVFDDPEKKGDLLTKRVAATEGQTIELRDGYIHVDGRQWTAPGQRPVRLPGHFRSGSATLEQGDLFVLGDNLLDSQDSISFGPVAEDSVRGKVWMIYWPPRHFGRLE